MNCATKVLAHIGAALLFGATFSGLVWGYIEFLDWVRAATGSQAWTLVIGIATWCAAWGVFSGISACWEKPSSQSADQSPATGAADNGSTGSAPEPDHP